MRAHEPNASLAKVEEQGPATAYLIFRHCFTKEAFRAACSHDSTRRLEFVDGRLNEFLTLSGVGSPRSVLKVTQPINVWCSHQGLSIRFDGPKELTLPRMALNHQGGQAGSD
jgi:hypothetical protein